MINNTISTQPLLCIDDVYDKLKTKVGNRVRYTTYFTQLWNVLLEMFEYKNLPDTIPKRFLESILHADGEVFVSKNEKTGELIASGGTLSGDVDAYGLGTECIAVYPTGESRGKRNIDIAYGINNDTATPDMFAYWIAHLMGETDKSINANVIYSRFLKIPKVSDEKDKATFSELFKKLKDGELEAFVSSNALDLELGAGAETFELTDVNKIDKIPYLTQFFEDLQKRFYTVYGQPMQNQNKRAQSISDEIHGQDSVSFIIPCQMLRCRQALVDNINRIFGTEIEVDFSPLWRLEYEALVLRDTNNNGTPDHKELNETETETETETNETETETDETETELVETDETLEDPDETLDEPAMKLEESDENETENDETRTERITEILEEIRKE